jgi:hypothetical protein
LEARRWVERDELADTSHSDVLPMPVEGMIAPAYC